MLAKNTFINVRYGLIYGGARARKRFYWDPCDSIRFQENVDFKEKKKGKDKEKEPSLLAVFQCLPTPSVLFSLNCASYIQHFTPVYSVVTQIIEVLAN